MTALERTEKQIAAIRSAMEAQEYDEALRLCAVLERDLGPLFLSVRQLRRLKQEAN